MFNEECETVGFREVHHFHLAFELASFVVYVNDVIARVAEIPYELHMIRIIATVAKPQFATAIANTHGCTIRHNASKEGNGKRGRR